MSDKKTFYQKLIDARKNISNPSRGGYESYKKRKYVTLQDLYDVALKPLMDNGLIIVHETEQSLEACWVTTKIVDVETEVSISSMSKINTTVGVQDVGSQLTYFKKYHLSGLLCLRCDKDDDGESIKNVKGPKAKLNKEQVVTVFEALSKLNKDKQSMIFKSLGTTDLTTVDADRYDKLMAFILKHSN